MKAIVFEQFGEPDQVLQMREAPRRVPAPGEVSVRMLASPVNPSDILNVRGEYGRRPSLPATPGFEGIGIVEAAGPGLLGWLRRGKRVAVLNRGGGNWQEQVVLPAQLVIPLPGDIPDEQGAVFFVNPASAVAMTQLVLAIPPGAWLLQSAAAGALGKMVIRLGRRYGFRTANVVRRSEQLEALKQLGADGVICTATEEIEKRVQQLTRGAGVGFALDAVGGDIGAAIVRSLGPGGRMLVYGNLSGQSIPLDSRSLMVANARVEGFWLSEWTRRQRAWTMIRLFRQIRRLISAGVLTSPVAASYPLEEVHQAVRKAQQGGGKVLLRIGQR